MKKLEGKELYRRLQEARNTKRFLMSMGQKMEAMEKKIEVLEASGRQKDETLVLQKGIIEKQALRIEYLEKIVFGKSKRKKGGDDDHGPASPREERQQRDSASYQREVPKEITDVKKYPIACCPDCRGSLTKKKIVERYVEDVTLPLRDVEKQLIESGYCENCGVRKNALSINGSRVVLGKNAKILVVYFSVVMRLSYQQIKNILRDMYHLKLSDGEIENILEQQSNYLTVEYERIAKELLNEAAHYDETSWKTPRGKLGNFAWIKTGVKTTNTLFLFGKSRGKDNAQKLCGKSALVGITDDYAGYDGVFDLQALCWAHPNRKLRDLAQSQFFTGIAKARCQKTHEAFQKIYKELRNIMASEESFEEKNTYKEYYWNEFSLIAKEEAGDPEKLKIYKTTLRKEQQKYFVFLDIEGIPMDNNQAERRLRHIVLKRKISLGSKTDKGATMLEKLYSVVLTWWWRDPINFIPNYRHLLA